ncbi:MAG: dihydroorotate dehydrogenase [Claussenomyces sp. TS43310]|nr:MAG: dihydroorotate dehydrogenase [Claussenomyces sp. TS43310]
MSQSMKKSPVPPFEIHPPLLNSANPWAFTLDDLKALYECPFTGAITTRTSLIDGFSHNSATHQYTFFSPVTGSTGSQVSAEGRGEVIPSEPSSLNTLGYSPIPLSEYLSWFTGLGDGRSHISCRTSKPVIVSVTGSAEEIARCYALMTEAQARSTDHVSFMMEINLSCPNILDKPPPAYDGAALAEYLAWVSKARDASAHDLHVGIKTPPYTYQGQFNTLISALQESTRLEGACPITFITACNTLGSCLVMKEDDEGACPALNSASGEGIGGMAGSALHPLALGNVATLRKMLDKCDEESIRGIAIIGTGGVGDFKGFERMKAVGAAAVGVGTALGREGIEVFGKILENRT